MLHITTSTFSKNQWIPVNNIIKDFFGCSMYYMHGNFEIQKRLLWIQDPQFQDELTRYQ